MILDASAIVAILLKEPGHDILLSKLASADHVAVGAPTLAETAIVLLSKIGPGGRRALAAFLSESEISVVDFSDAHWRAAADAYGRFGKGRHRAALNFGDCLTYAVAKLSSRPLLATGNDFSRTDLALA
ncbi:MAG: type II toxin-antitoxin system VapC family toxin [Vicinamibacteria bacterium]|nr:type II toxin-antitoxin system VapC family toxin [Vicinamibacteria bacterium]